MLRFVNLLVCVFCASWIVVSPQLLDYFEGDICKQKNGTTWSCKALEECPASRESGSEETLQNCSSAEVKQVVCCEDQSKNSTAGSKSNQACKKYGEAVYAYLATTNKKGNKFLLDTCTDAFIGAFIGREAFPREFPHLALIGYGAKDSIEWSCGGSLISENFVLSAAHCTNTSKGMARWVRLGEYNKRSTIDEEQEYAKPVEYEIVERVNHPEYSSSKGAYNDIALYKLSNNVQFSIFTRPACLQTQHQFPNTYAIAVGWGRNQWGGREYKVPQKSGLLITPRKQCDNAYPLKKDAKLRAGVIDATMLCAGDKNPTKDSCQAGSGGALQLRMSDPYCMYSLVGVSSHGAQCGSGKPGIYTRVSHFVPWIESVVWPNEIYNGSYIIGA